MLHTGAVLQNRYRIKDILGQGGMGAVYRAEDRRLNVEVAIKEMIPQPNLDPQSLSGLRQQFRQEAMVLARLSHPALVNVTDFFEEQGNAYLVMNFVAGEHLADLIQREGAQPPDRVLRWATELLEALAYCHGQGVLHRDIKPLNIVIRADDHPVLVDFGLVKLWDPQSPHTRTVIRGLGSPEYAPPEQYSVQHEHTDPRSDLYSLAATLYHALTGQTPPSATERMARPERFVPLRQLNPDVPQHVERAILRAMELRQADRFASAREMLTALTRPSPAAQPAPVPAVPQAIPGTARLFPTPPPAPKKRMSKSRWWIAAGLLLLLACCVGAGLLSDRLLKATSPVPVSASPAPSATATRTPPPTRRPTSTPRPTSTRPAAPPAYSSNAVQPVLLSPQQDSTQKNPLIFQWEGELGPGQAYVVKGINTRTQYEISSPPLSTTAWRTEVPAEAFGEWRWSVSVVQNETVLSTSEEGKFWFNEFK
ncbi:MAG: serine/threonine-protein kinase [Anaerolineae bacterium]